MSVESLDNVEFTNNTVQSDSVLRVATRLPPLWKSNITVWFIQVEASFNVSCITNDETKYNYLLSAIDADTLSAVSDLIIAPPEGNKYQALKDRLVKEFSDSQSSQIRKLLCELTLGDKKPSVLLRQIKELSRNSITDEFLKTIWLERLPTHIQAILSASTSELTELNDGVRKSLQPPYNGPYAVIKHGAKVFKVMIKGKNVTVSVDRLKPAFLSADKDNVNQPEEEMRKKDEETSYRTKYGRTVHFPKNYGHVIRG
ncbi:uncharacterized protein LOC129221033 [Uloborus diversus]|uniref:uncharacterized protein LOC129221033 n=1 Tax=Uloborus diversus TaxID=327109 RepID=UPI00240A1EEF|nr:uncharacterized protein LOC129221033 [Uloborus diversus]